MTNEMNDELETVVVTDAMKKRNQALGLVLFGVVLLIGVVSYLNIEVAMPS